MRGRRAELLRIVAQRAARGADQLTPDERADLFEGVGLILEGQESEAAKLAAFSIRQSEKHQLQFHELMRQACAKNP